CRIAGVTAARLMIAAVFVVVSCTTTFAQGTQGGPPAGAGPPGDNNPIRIDRQRQIDESGLRQAELRHDTAAENEKRLQAAIVNIRENFTRIQVLRNDIARNLVARRPLDYKLISQQTGEINKRASRLNLYMWAHADNDNKEPHHAAELQNEEMIGALVRLCKLVDSFTENPALKNAGAVDVKQIDKVKEEKARADRDLLAIIKLSESIRKKSESLKTGQ
ncbi:MAG: hypothetical protein ACRD9S_19895, partial [Pyrinomonadaceae bacterium]